MPLQICGGRLITMTPKGIITGDILISGGEIVCVEDHIERGDCPDIHVLNADGLTIMPGMIDPFIACGGCDPAWLRDTTLMSGVTSGLLIPEGDSDACQLLTGKRIKESNVTMIKTAATDNPKLLQLISEYARAGQRVMLSVYDADSCMRALEVAEESGVQLILTGLHGCMKLIGEIVRIGAAAVIGMRHGPGETPWRMAAALDEADVTIALSCCHPFGELKRLPVCASLCVRNGMRRDRAIRAITMNPAEMLGLADRGRLAPGCRADLVIFDADPLLLAASRVMTIAGGRIVP